MGVLAYLFDKFVDYDGIRKVLKELSEDPKKLSNLIELQMDEAIRESHPEDYDAFTKTHKGELESIRHRLILKYGKEIRERVSGLID